jgi:putative transposase
MSARPAMHSPTWYTAAQLLELALPSLPGDKGGISRLIVRQGWRASPLAREGAEGWEYHPSLLPAEAQAELLKRELQAGAPSTARGAVPLPRDAGEDQGGIWEAFERLPATAKAAAEKRLGIVDQVMTLRAGGMKAGEAVALVAKRAAVSGSTLWGWLKHCEGAPRAHWLAALAPRHKGRTSTAECDPRAWDFLVADYLRAERPSFSACHRRLLEAAAVHGWGPIPAEKTLQRRLEALPQAVRTLARHGRDALAAMYPHQTRDRSGFAAMEAVNADGHKFDVFVRFEDGTIGRPVATVVQDLASGMIVGWRVAQSENWTSVRLAFADAITRFGIPQKCWLDNGRAFASKWLTGGMKTRYRFKVKDDEPSGILTQLGIKVHWATPYHGQAKPIERAFRDLCEEIAKHPECAGAYTGNSVAAKPENYGARAMPIAQFRALVHREMVRHNARTGRRGMGMDGRSFADVFAESYERDMAYVAASAAQRRLLLLAVEDVKCLKPTGEVHLGRNRYHADALTDHIGQHVHVRFDPDDLHAAVAIYSRDGRLICEAPCIEASGFADHDAAQTNGRNKNAWLKSKRQQLQLERRMGIEEVAGLMPGALPPVSAAEAGVVRLFNGAPPPPAAPVPLPRDAGEDQAATSALHLSRAIRALADDGEADILPFKREAG